MLASPLALAEWAAANFLVGRWLMTRNKPFWSKNNTPPPPKPPISHPRGVHTVRYATLRLFLTIAGAIPMNTLLPTALACKGRLYRTVSHLTVRFVWGFEVWGFWGVFPIKPFARRFGPTRPKAPSMTPLAAILCPHNFCL